MTKKKSKPASKRTQNQPPRPSFKSLLIQYILLTMAFYFMFRSCEKSRLAKLEAEKQKTEQTADSSASNHTPLPGDSLALERLQQTAGDFAYAWQKPPASPFEIETGLWKIRFNPKGGTIDRLILKKFDNARGNPVRLIDHNQDFHLNLHLTDGKTISTKDFPFRPTIERTDSLITVTMRLEAGPGKALIYEYRIRPDDYMMDFNIRSEGLQNLLEDGFHDLHWDLAAYSHEFDPAYEDKFTALKYEYENGKTGDLSALAAEKEKEATGVNWVDFKQHFFSSFLITPQKAFDTAKLKQKRLYDKEKDTLHTKHFFVDTRLQSQGGNLHYAMKWFHGPNDYDLLKSYGYGMEEVIPLGWGIFGWVNKYLFIPLFDFLKKFISNYGLIIILMTLFVRLITSPLYYKTYVSQAKMKIIRPEMDEINRKYKNNPLKRQKEIMELQSKAGVSPLSGCIPSLLFIPIFYALFRFFPAELDLRHKGFLWVKDLSSYESFITLPVKLPFIGNHISLFALIAALLMFFYMRMNQSAQSMSMPTQEGMPDMTKMMKWMLYLMPFMMFFFFNNYASGLSLYYMVSTFLSLVIVYVIKNYVIDEEKVKAQIEANKKKPRKQSRFQAKLQALMEQAEEQRRLQEEMKRKRKKK